MEENFPEARAGSLPPGSRVCVCSLELYGHSEFQVGILDLGVLRMSGGRYGSSEASRIPVFYPAVSAIPHPRPSFIPPQTAA